MASATNKPHHHGNIDFLIFRPVHHQLCQRNSWRRCIANCLNGIFLLVSVQARQSQAGSQVDLQSGTASSTHLVPENIYGHLRTSPSSAVGAYRESAPFSPFDRSRTPMDRIQACGQNECCRKPPQRQAPHLRASRSQDKPNSPGACLGSPGRSTDNKIFIASHPHRVRHIGSSS